MKFSNVKDRFGKVAVLMGGVSSEREVSLNSGKFVLRALHARGIDAYPFDPRDEEIGTLKIRGFNRVFNALHGGIGENGALQGALDVLGLPYTGDGMVPCVLGFDKVRCKMLWNQSGINTPNYLVIQNQQHILEERMEKIIYSLKFPLFVKPARNGSSIAVSKVSSEQKLFDAIHAVLEIGDDVLVEEAVHGDEYTYTLLNGFDLPLIKIVSSGIFYDYYAKYVADSTQYLIPCGLTQVEEKNVVTLCLRAFNILGCQRWGRIDFIIDRSGQCYFLEVNTAPGLTDHSLSPKALAAVGMDYDDLIFELISQTLIS